VQQRVIAGYAQMNGLTVDRVFVERGVSGSKPLANRPQGGELLGPAAAGRYRHHPEARPHVPLRWVSSRSAASRCT
jgi:hypothetical protein